MSALGGTATLTGLAVRRDRLLLPFWVPFPALIALAFVTAFTTAFPTPEALQEYAATSIGNFAFTIFYGRLLGSSLGQMVTWRAGFVPVMVGLISLLVVVRHTRTEEEAGRSELIGSTAVSREAGLAAALAMTGGATAILGALAALALMSTGLPIAGSVAYGLGLTTVAWTFAAVGAVVAQLTTGAGTARVIGIIVLGVAFLLRGVGDISAQGGGGLGWISWLSPLSWGAQLRPFSGERWWVLGIVLCADAALIATAVVLSRRRDIGSGLLAARSGPAVAAPGLRSPFALAWRLNRGSLASWIILCVVIGVALGGIATSIADLLTNSSAAAREAIERLGGQGSIIDQYFWAMIRGLALAGCIYAIQRVVWLKAEESSGRSEYLLAAPVERLRWAAGNFGIVLLGASIGPILCGAMAGLTHGLISGTAGRELLRVTGAVLVTLPAIWIFGGLAFAVFGWLPRFVAGTFAVFIASVFLGWAGEELQLGQWVMNLSAFTHLPILPGGELEIVPLFILSTVAALLISAGALGIRQRDILIG